jgi:hypothetical protein
MEATKWLKPSISVSRIGDSASVQAVTRVNAEQSSKRTMRRPTRQPFGGRLIRLGRSRAKSTPSRCAGVVATACTQGNAYRCGHYSRAFFGDGRAPLASNTRPVLGLIQRAEFMREEFASFGDFLAVTIIGIILLRSRVLTNVLC